MPSSQLIKDINSKIQKQHFEEALLFVSVGIISAVVCAFYARLFAMMEGLSISLLHSSVYALILLPPAFLIIAYFLVRLFAPGSSGSGIPQVLTCIEEPHHNFKSLFLSKAVIVIKILSSLVAVLGGAAIGREGPSLQISGAIAYQLGKFSERFGIKVKENQLLVAGAASGLAAAFNTPIGGVVYAIEELSKDHVRTFRDVLLLSVVIAGLTAQLINGYYLYLGYPELSHKITFPILGLIILCGIASGLMGALFSNLLLALAQWRGSKKISGQILILIALGLIISLAFHFIGERSLYSGKESINHILFTNELIPWQETLARVFMPILSSMSGIAGGVFAPSLSAGAVVGEAISQIFDPTMRNILAVSGMVGFLTGVTHTPITSLILVLEMTDRHSAVFPMMTAALFSSLVAHLVSDKSFYEESVERIKKTIKA